MIKSIPPISLKPLLLAKESFGEMTTKLDVLLKSSLFAKHIDTKNDLILRMAKTLDLLKTQSEIMPSSSTIIDQVHYSGINYESKIKRLVNNTGPFILPSGLRGDLKGQVLELIKAMHNSKVIKGSDYNTGLQFKEIIKTLHLAIDNIEFHQLTNQFARQENQPIVLQIPNPFLGENKTIKLYLRKLEDQESGEKNKTNNSLLLVFLLDLTILGKIRVDARLNAEIVALKIGVEDKAIAGFIKMNLDDFQSQLTSLGFQNQVSCYVTENIECEIENDINQLMINSKDHLIDLIT